MPHIKSFVKFLGRRSPDPISSPGSPGVMKFLLSRQQVRLAIGAILVLSIQVLGAPRSVWAGCNHLVRSNQQIHGGSDDLDALVTGWTSTEHSTAFWAGHSTYPQPAPFAPCSGPSCSRQVPVPVSANVVGAFDLVHWALLAESIDLVWSLDRSESTEERLPAPLANPSRVFHPPRSPADPRRHLVNR